MLIELSVENYRSIKERVTFSMLATPDTELDQNIFRVPSIKNAQFFKTAFLYGPNASGKTNILLALYYLRRIIRDNTQLNKGDKLLYDPFLLDEEYSKKPSSFEVKFVVDNVLYTYGVSLDERKVHSEYLYSAPKGRKALIFDRTDNEVVYATEKKLHNAIKNRLTDNRLYLSFATNENIQQTAPAVKWFTTFLKFRFDTQNSWEQYTSECLSKEDKRAKKIQEFLRRADLGIQGVVVKKFIVTEDMIAPHAPKEIREKMLGSELRDVELSHLAHNANGIVSLPLEEESQGTQVAYALAGPLFDVLENGYVFVIDEIEMSMHPHIVQEVIMLFHDPECNPNNAQLISSTHATAFLNSQLLRRDQIWFTQKDPDTGATELYSLADLRGVRKNDNFEKNYWSGRYGAIPFLGNGLMDCSENCPASANTCANGLQRKS